jgi:AbiV family abortive infection protein
VKMQDPENYKILFENIHRLLQDAELLLDTGRWVSANATAILAIEEAGKFTSLLSSDGAKKDSRNHKRHQEAMGEYFTSVAFFEAVVREMDPMMEHLKTMSPDGYAQAMAMPRDELIRFTMTSLATDPDFDMQRFIRRVVGEDDSTGFAKAVAEDNKYHKERLQSNYVDYDSAGNLCSNPFEVTQEQAERTVDLARFAAKLQELWFDSWGRTQADAPGVEPNDPRSALLHPDPNCR